MLRNPNDLLTHIRVNWPQRVTHKSVLKSNPAEFVENIHFALQNITECIENEPLQQVLDLTICYQHGGYCAILWSLVTCWEHDCSPTTQQIVINEKPCNKSTAR